MPARLTSSVSRRLIRGGGVLSGVSLGAMTLTRTFESIGIEVPFTESGGTLSEMTVQFKKSADSTWRAGLPLWAVRPASEQAACYGSVLLCDAGTAYDVRVTAVDAIGGTQVVTGSITTRAEDIAAPASLTPTRYVRADGDDTNAGTSDTSGGAWRTLDRARSQAPEDAVVQVGPGYYACPSTTTARLTTMVLKAQNVAVNGDKTMIAAASRSFIEPRGSDGWPSTSGPTEATDPDLVGRTPNRIAPWVLLTGGTALVGAELNGCPAATYEVWKWTTAPVSGATAYQMAFSATRGGDPIRIPNWANQGSVLDNPGAMIELIQHNLDYTNAGVQGYFWSSGSDIYLVMPSDTSGNPNDYYIWVGSGQVWFRTSDDNRLCGFDIRCTYVHIGLGNGAEPIARTVVDFNRLSVIHTAFTASGPRFDPWDYTGLCDHVVQDNIFLDTGSWSTDPARPAVPWRWIKQTVRYPNGTASSTRMGGNQESTTTTSNYGGSQFLVFRRNLVDGFFNGIGSGINTGYTRYATMGWDIHDNVFRNCADDPFEPEQAAINWRLWDNQTENSLTVLSTGPLDYGPLYLVRHRAWRIGAHGVGVFAGGEGVGGVGFKYSEASVPKARPYILHCTFWTDASGVTTDTAAPNAGGFNESTEAFYIRNSIFRVTRYAWDHTNSQNAWSDDGNLYATSDAARGIRWTNGVIYDEASDVATLRGLGGLGSTSNKIGGVDQQIDAVAWLDALLTDPANSDLTYTGSRDVAPVANVSDLDAVGGLVKRGYIP